MSSGVYGGDEVGALVFDPGHNSFRAGYAGEDNPKIEVTSYVCSLLENFEQMEIDGSKINNVKKKKYYIGSNYINIPRQDAEMVNFLNDGMITDWDLFEKMLNYIYSTLIMSLPEDHPVLMSEASWNSKQNREKIAEIMFEKYNIPAFFLIKNSVLAAFANGRSTALVFDSGASQSSAVSVFDGYVIQNSIVRTSQGSEFVSNLCKKYFDENQIEVIPSYMVASKKQVSLKEKPIWTQKKNLPQVTKSWHNYMVNQVIDDFQTCVLQILDEPFTKEAVEGVAYTPYEFPNGYNQEFCDERYTIPEVLFNPSFNPKTSNEIQLSMSEVLTKSASLCDIDIRPALYSSVIITGGNTLLTGFNDRILADVNKKIPPNIRVKLMYLNGFVERRHSPWIGGSIIASLGTFQRMWFSKREYEESGKTQIHKKCP